MERNKWISERGVFLSLFILYSFLILGAVFGGMKFSLGARAGGMGDFLLTLAQWGLYGVVLHFLLFVPLVHWVFPFHKESLGPWAQLGIATVLISIPLLSFAYYMETQSGLFNAADRISMIVPAVALAWAWYRLTRRRWIFSWFCTVATFIPLFVLQDGLGPYAVWIEYAPQDSSFYALRNWTPWIALALTLYLFGKSRATTSR